MCEAYDAIFHEIVRRSVTCSASVLLYPSGERFVLLQNFRSAVYVLDGRNRLTVEAMH